MIITWSNQKTIHRLCIIVDNPVDDVQSLRKRENIPVFMREMCKKIGDNL